MVERVGAILLKTPKKKSVSVPLKKLKTELV